MLAQNKATNFNQAADTMILSSSESDKSPLIINRLLSPPLEQQANGQQMTSSPSTVAHTIGEAITTATYSHYTSTTINSDFLSSSLTAANNLINSSISSNDSSSFGSSTEYATVNYNGLIGVNGTDKFAYTAESRSFALPIEIQILMSIFYGALAFTAIASNMIVCYIVLSNQRMRTATNYFIVNLAVGDILMALLCIPFTFFSNLIFQYWPFGLSLCVIVSYSQAISVFISAYTMVSISIDKYLAIMYPMRLRMPKIQAKIIILVIWSAALITSLPAALLSGLTLANTDSYSSGDYTGGNSAANDNDSSGLSNFSSGISTTTTSPISVNNTDTRWLTERASDSVTPMVVSPMTITTTMVSMSRPSLNQKVRASFSGGGDSSSETPQSNLTFVMTAAAEAAAKPLSTFDDSKQHSDLTAKTNKLEQAQQQQREEEQQQNNQQQQQLKQQFHQEQKKYFCSEQWDTFWPPGKYYYSMALMILQFVLPLFVLVITYSRIVIVVWGKRMPGEEDDARDARMARSKRKMIKMVIFCVIAFALTWLPFNVLIIIGDINENIWAHPNILYIWFILHWLAMCHTITNPLIYIWMNNRFRAGFKQVINDLWHPIRRLAAYLWFTCCCFGCLFSCSRRKYLRVASNLKRKQPLNLAACTTSTNPNQTNAAAASAAAANHHQAAPSNGFCLSSGTGNRRNSRGARHSSSSQVPLPPTGLSVGQCQGDGSGSQLQSAASAGSATVVDLEDRPSSARVQPEQRPRQQLGSSSAAATSARAEAQAPTPSLNFRAFRRKNNTINYANEADNDATTKQKKGPQTKKEPREQHQPEARPKKRRRKRGGTHAINIQMTAYSGGQQQAAASSKRAPVSSSVPNCPSCKHNKQAGAGTGSSGGPKRGRSSVLHNRSSSICYSGSAQSGAEGPDRSHGLSSSRGQQFAVDMRQSSQSTATISLPLTNTTSLALSATSSGLNEAQLAAGAETGARREQQEVWLPQGSSLRLAATQPSAAASAASAITHHSLDGGLLFVGGSGLTGGCAGGGGSNFRQSSAPPTTERPASRRIRSGDDDNSGQQAEGKLPGPNSLPGSSSLSEQQPNNQPPGNQRVSSTTASSDNFCPSHGGCYAMNPLQQPPEVGGNQLPGDEMDDDDYEEEDDDEEVDDEEEEANLATDDDVNCDVFRQQETAFNGPASSTRSRAPEVGGRQSCGLSTSAEWCDTDKDIEADDDDDEAEVESLEEEFGDERSPLRGSFAMVPLGNNRKQPPSCWNQKQGDTCTNEQSSSGQMRRPPLRRLFRSTGDDLGLWKSQNEYENDEGEDDDDNQELCNETGNRRPIDLGSSHRSLSSYNHNTTYTNNNNYNNNDNHNGNSNSENSNNNSGKLNEGSKVQQQQQQRRDRSLRRTMLLNNHLLSSFSKLPPTNSNNNNNKEPQRQTTTSGSNGDDSSVIKANYNFRAQGHIFGEAQNGTMIIGDDYHGHQPADDNHGRGCGSRSSSPDYRHSCNGSIFGPSQPEVSSSTIQLQKQQQQQQQQTYELSMDSSGEGQKRAAAAVLASAAHTSSNLSSSAPGSTTNTSEDCGSERLAPGVRKRSDRKRRQLLPNVGVIEGLVQPKGNSSLSVSLGASSFASSSGQQQQPADPFGQVDRSWQREQNSAKRGDSSGGIEGEEQTQTGNGHLVTGGGGNKGFLSAGDVTTVIVRKSPTVYLISKTK